MTNLMDFFFNRGNTRDILVRRHAFYSLLLKVLNTAFSLLLIRITLNYLDEYEYGIWVTFSSILTWICSFDIGFGNGLQNKLGESLAKKDMLLSREYISTAFFSMSFIAVVFLILALILFSFLDWAFVLNAKETVIPHLNLYMNLFLAIFLVYFVLRLIGKVYLAHMQASVNILLFALSTMLSFFVTAILVRIREKGSFIEIGLIYVLSNLAIYLVAYLYTFYVRFPDLRPSTTFFQKKQLRDLLELGWQFFLLQIGVVVLFLSSNLIISHIWGPQEVTGYNIAYKYFSMLYMAAGVIAVPIWPAVTNAYTKNDYEWIRKAFRKTMLFFFGIVAVFLLMLLVSPVFYRIWLGKDMKITYCFSAVIMLYNIILTYNSFVCAFINGIGKIRLQLYLFLSGMILYPLLGMWSGKSVGIMGLILVLSLIIFVIDLILTVQYFWLVSPGKKEWVKS